MVTITALPSRLISIGRSGATRTVTTAGQFIVTTVYKATAADFYIYDNTNNRYLCKGKNVR